MIHCVWRRLVCPHALCGILVALQACLCSAQTTTNQAAATPTAAIPPLATASWMVLGSVVTQRAGGLNVTVDSRWCNTMGYRPIRICITPTATVPSDRELIVRAAVHRVWNPTDCGIVCEQFISIPSGTQPSQTITGSLSLPPAPLWSDFSLEIIDPALTSPTVFKQQQIKGIGPISAGPSAGTVLNNYPRVLFMGYAAPNTTEVSACLSQLKGYPINEADMAAAGTGQASSGQNNVALPMAMALPIGEMPDRWIDYSGLDAACLSMDQLADLAAQRPSAYSDLMHWIESGGNLWVYGLSGTSGRQDRLPELEKRVKTSNWIQPDSEMSAQNGQPQPSTTLLDDAHAETENSQTSDSAAAPRVWLPHMRVWHRHRDRHRCGRSVFRERQLGDAGLGFVADDDGAWALAMASPARRILGRTRQGFLELPDSRYRTGPGEDVSDSYHAVRGCHRAGQLLALVSAEKAAFDGSDCSVECHCGDNCPFRLCPSGRRPRYSRTSTQHHAVGPAARHGGNLGKAFVLCRLDALEGASVFAGGGHLSHLRSFG